MASRFDATTDRLHLRPVLPADTGRLLALHTDAEVMRYLGAPEPVARRAFEQQTVARMARRYACLGGAPAYLVAEAREDSRFVGWFELRPVRDDDASVVELGYRLRRETWGRGYATEGAVALVRRAFTELGSEQVVAETMAVNVGSRRVLEKAGLRYVRTFFGDWPDPLPGSEHGEVRYALTRDEWRRQRDARRISGGTGIARNG